MNLKISILIDNKNSWIIPYSKTLLKEISCLGHECNLIHNHSDVSKGDILILLSCNKIFKSLNLNRYNLVVHESDLPKGRGMSPLTWQVIEGKSIIPVTLLEASNMLDAGVIYAQTKIKLTGFELIDEMRNLQFNASKNLILDFINNFPNNDGIEQVGIPSTYRSRDINDSKLDLSKSIDQQFNLLRVSDNERYPAWFEKNGHKYKLQITKFK